MNTSTIPRWQTKRTTESKLIEDVLEKAGFPNASAYRHNSASIRVRIIDDRFRGVSDEDRDDLVEPTLDTLPLDIQSDIVNLLLMYPGEEKDSSRVFLFNAEFEQGESGL